ncbi:MAG: diiron oxygenase [Acidimicrobiales bacterium]
MPWPAARPAARPDPAGLGAPGLAPAAHRTPPTGDPPLTAPTVASDVLVPTPCNRPSGGLPSPHGRHHLRHRRRSRCRRHHPRRRGGGRSRRSPSRAAQPGVGQPGHRADQDLPGSVGDGQLVPDELLSVVGLGLDLTPEQKRTLSREEVASMFDNGIRFEAVLEAGFAMQIAYAPDITDPRITFLCHEIGEETRHQRMFQRVIAQIQPTAKNPLAGNRLLMRVDRAAPGCSCAYRCAYVMVISGEEIPTSCRRCERAP